MKLLIILAGLFTMNNSCKTLSSPVAASQQHNNIFPEINPQKEEAQILSYINEMRQNPRQFYKKHLQDYIRQNKDRFTAYYINSLEKDMNSTAPLALFTIQSVLTTTASSQAKYLAPYRGKKLDHDRPGLSFEQRLQKAGINCGAENLYTGINRTALQVVMDLLIDQHVQSLGHRRNLLSPSYHSIGIAVETFSGGGQVVVMDFGCN